MKPRECHEPSCTKIASWGASKRPAWCQEHAIAKFRSKGLEPLEPVEKLTTFTLTRCLTCGCETHCKLDYALSRYDPEEPACRACYWKEWAIKASQYSGRSPVDPQHVRQKAEDADYEYLGPLTDPCLNEDPHHVKCKHCGRQSAERPGDIGWGCACQRRSRRSTPAPSKAPKKALLQHSDNPALAWWDHERNSPESFATVTATATREAHWVCPDCGHRFTKRVRYMADWFPMCPVCQERRRARVQLELERYRTMTVAQLPELLSAWADDTDPNDAAVLANFPLRRFRCSKGHHPKLVPYTYLTSGCPHCRASETIRANEELFDEDQDAVRLDPEMASQWHPTANGKWDLRKVSPNSRRMFTWLCAECGHIWEDSPKGRSYASALRCPSCRSIFDSLAYHHPDLASEWSDSNPKSAWHVRPTSAAFVPTWVCSTDTRHIFQMSVASRTKGGSCPECSEHGKSRIELEHFYAAEARLGNASSGKTIATGRGLSRRTWRLDIAVNLPGSTQLLIEYDGSYWHRDKSQLDLSKSQALLEEGYWVVRLREHPLAPLPIEHRTHYMEIEVHSAAPDPDGCMQQIRTWIDSKSRPPL